MKDTIRFLRERENYSQAGVACEIGVSRQMYIKYENGLVEPPVSVVRDLCKLYKVPYETIIDDRFKGIADAKYKQSMESEDGSMMASEPMVSYVPRSLDLAIENLKKLTDDKLVCASSYIDYLVTSENAYDPHRKNQALLRYAGKIHLDFDVNELERFREESLI